MSSLWWKCSTGSEREFSTQTSIVRCNEGKMCLSAHAFEDWILARCLRKFMPFLLHFQLHTLTFSHTSMLSTQCWNGRGEREAQRRRVFPLKWYSSWVMRSSTDGLSSVVTERRYRGDKDGLDKVGIFQNERRADTSSAVSYIFKHSPPAPASLNTPPKSNKDTECCWRGRWHEDRDRGKRLEDT